MPSHLYTQWNARGEENVSVCLCVSADADFVHSYWGYFFPTWIHCSTNWTNFSYWWGDVAMWTLRCNWKASSSSEQTVTQNFPVKQKVKISVFTLTVAGATTRQWFSNIVLLIWKFFSSTANLFTPPMSLLHSFRSVFTFHCRPCLQTRYCVWSGQTQTP